MGRLGAVLCGLMMIVMECNTAGFNCKQDEGREGPGKSLLRYSEVLISLSTILHETRVVSQREPRGWVHTTSQKGLFTAE